MDQPPLPLLTADTLRTAVGPVDGCPHCAALRCDSWESVGVPLGPPQLVAVGTLRDPAIDEPIYDERLEPGMDTWHPRAPVAVRHAATSPSSAKAPA